MSASAMVQPLLVDVGFRAKVVKELGLVLSASFSSMVPVLEVL